MRALINRFKIKIQLCTLKKEWRLTPSAAGGGGGGGGVGAGGKGGLVTGRYGQAGPDGGPNGGVPGAGNPSANGGTAPGGTGGALAPPTEAEMDDLKKIRKVQGFFRGWLCRHRWKVIVEEYIKSPHAESMRKRNRSVNELLKGDCILNVTEVVGYTFFIAELLIVFLKHDSYCTYGAWVRLGLINIRPDIAGAILSGLRRINDS